MSALPLRRVPDFMSNVVVDNSMQHVDEGEGHDR